MQIIKIFAFNFLYLSEYKCRIDGLILACLDGRDLCKDQTFNTKPINTKSGIKQTVFHQQSLKGNASNSTLTWFTCTPS